MYYIKKTFEISASHHLTLSYSSKCTNVHGHNWKITVYCKSKELNRDGMLEDFTRIKQEIHGRLDHQDLNKIFTFNPWVLFDETIFELGWDEKDARIAIIALLILWWVSVLQERGVPIRKTVATWPLPLRWLFYYGAIFSVLIFGIYGRGVSASAFAYMNF